MPAGGGVEAGIGNPKLQFIGDDTIFNIGQPMLLRPCLCTTHHGFCNVKTNYIPQRADTLRDGKGWIAIPARQIEHALSRCDAAHSKQPLGDRDGWPAYVVASPLPTRSGSAPLFALLMTNLFSLFNVYCHDVCLPFATSTGSRKRGEPLPGV